MKPVFLIAIVAVAMIGVIVPNALGETYVDDGIEPFTIDYPQYWTVDTYLDGSVIFSDRNYETIIGIGILENYIQGSDDEELELIFQSMYDVCNGDQSCTNFYQFDDSPTFATINGNPAIIAAMAEYTTEDLGYQTETTSHIFYDDKVAIIISVSDDGAFVKHKGEIIDTILSFQPTKKLESESFKLEIRENDDLVSKDVDFIFATDSLGYDEKLHGNCSNLQDVFETLGANNFRTMFATDNESQRCLIKTSEELERIEELTTTNSVFIIITDKLKNKGYVELFFDDDLIQSFSFTEDELEKRIELKYAFPDYYEEYTLTAINGDYFASVLWTPLPSLSAIDKHPNLELLEKTDETKSILIEEVFDVSKSKEIPSWIKNNAGWWADGTIDDNSFVQGIQFLVKEGIISVDSTSQSNVESKAIPTWVKNNAGWWADGTIDDSTFITGIEFLVKEGIILVD
ncbi:hypothetical protein PL987_01960 [Nitrosopumilus sp.]|nr:hypothetical protein [Nitrosopumilus sp.]